MILGYVLWLVASAGGFYLLIRVRVALLLGLALIVRDRDLLVVIDKFSFLLIGVGFVPCIVAIESSLVGMITGTELARRFVTILGIELLVLGVISVIFQLAGAPRFGVVVLAAELVSGLALVNSKRWWPRAPRQA